MAAYHRAAKAGGLVQGLKFLLKEWEELEQWPQLPESAKNGQPTLEGSLDIALAVQHAAEAENVRNKIGQIHKDILGVYRFSKGPPSVDLFWMPIAMVAAMQEVAIEDLTVVVLIHELAHGYTHLGRDIDGTRWEDDGFAKSDLEVTEGLAQFYTEVVSERLMTRTPGVLAAYHALLKLQSGPYCVHREWLSGDRVRMGETIRFTLIAARRYGQVGYDMWRNIMESTARRLDEGPGHAVYHSTTLSRE